MTKKTTEITQKTAENIGKRSKEMLIIYFYIYIYIYKYNFSPSPFSPRREPSEKLTVSVSVRKSCLVNLV